MTSLCRFTKKKKEGRKEGRKMSSALKKGICEEVTSSYLYNEWAIGSIDDTIPAPDIEELQRTFEEKAMAKSKQKYKSKLFEITDCFPLIRESVKVLVNDEFTRCFEAPVSKPWNWNIYLYPTWVLGVLLRYLILFPIRLLIFIVGTILFIISFSFVSSILKNVKVKFHWQRKLISFWAKVFVTSWWGVVAYHGTKPKREPNSIHVANHSSLIDVIILQQQFSYAIVGQKHKGVVGSIQDKVLACLGCLWFERSDIADRLAVGRKISEHIQNPDTCPLLIFPEGTCVNNRYCVMFKKGAFDIGAKIYPIAIKYNHEFCNPYWNSRKESFLRHLFNLMTSWAVVCDVYFLPPQTIQPNETSVQFANRVKQMIADKAGLVCVPWDGYLKHLRPPAKFVEYRQKLIAKSLLRRIPTADPKPDDDLDQDNNNDNNIEINNNNNNNNDDNNNNNERDKENKNKLLNKEKKFHSSPNINAISRKAAKPSSSSSSSPSTPPSSSPSSVRRV